MKWNKLQAINLIIIFLAIFVSILIYIFLSHNNLVLVYGDSKGHLNIARRVFDSPTPGIAQLGGYWLPVLHVIMLLTVWNNYLWQTGLSGSIPNMIMYVALIYVIYKFVFEISNSRFISSLSSLIILLNPSLLVLQATPMTETTFIFLFATGCYLFYKWSKNTRHFLYLIGSAFFLSLCSLTRYEGWASVLFGTLIIFFVWLKSKCNKAYESSIILYSFLAWFGIALWILWDAIIIKNPLDFIQNAQSAKTQVQLFYSTVKATGEGNIPLAILTNLFSLIHTSGVMSVTLLFIAILFLLIKQRSKIFSINNLALFLLLSAFIFDIVAVYFGNVPVEVPELSKALPPGNMFNIRYSLFALPAIAVFVGILSNKKKVLSSILFLLIFINYCFMIVPSWRNIAALNDAGASGQSKDDLERIAWFKKNYDRGYILVSTGAADGLCLMWECHLRIMLLKVHINFGISL